MYQVKILPFGLKHVDGVHKVSNLCFTVPWSRESIETEVTNEFANYVVAVIDDEVVGFGGMWVLLDEADITNIAVNPAYQGRQIGNKILEALIEICRNDNIPYMTLEVRITNLVAQNLYKKQGFLQEGIRKKFYENNKEDAVIMWKRDVL